MFGRIGVTEANIISQVFPTFEVWMFDFALTEGTSAMQSGLYPGRLT